MIQKAQKNCLIIHGCPPTQEKFLQMQTQNFIGSWIGYIKQELSMRNVLTKSPIMPRAFEPNYEKYKYELLKYSINENTILIGHSCACSFLVRYLGDTKKKVAKLILVAPMNIAKEEDVSKKAFYDFEIDKTIKERVKDIVIFTSDNEEERGQESAKIFNEALGGEIISISGYGHYRKDDMGNNKFIELLKVVLR